MPWPESRTDTATAGEPSANPARCRQQAETPTLGHGVAGVDGEVLERDFERSRVGAARRAGMADIDGDLDPVVQRAAQQTREGSEQGEQLHVGRVPRLLARTGEQVVGEPFAAVDEGEQRRARDGVVVGRCAAARGVVLKFVPRRLHESAQHDGSLCRA
jgi:hypothetical protein